MELFRHSPDAACEILLSLLIREPLPTKPGIFGSEPDRFLHVKEIRKWSPAMFFRGPFLSFLRIDPAKGVELIVKLVNFLTDRWIDKHEGAAPSLKIAIDGIERPIFGGSEVYFWYRDFNRTPNVAAVALMALEKWFYMQLDDEQPVGAAIDQVLKTSQSTAFLGLLSTVARKKPDLLDSELFPMAAVWQMQIWEENHRIRGDDKLWGLSMMQWSRLGEGIYNVAAEWHQLEHRNTTIGDVLLQRCILDRDFCDRMKAHRDAWNREATQAVLPEIEANYLERINIQFDPEHWSFHQDGNQIQVEFSEPTERTARLLPARETNAKHMRLLRFPLRCRQLLDSRTELDTDTVEEFWRELSAIGKDAEDALLRGDQPEHSIGGGIAVLFALHEPWLLANPNKRKWCFDQIERIRPSPPQPPDFDVPNSISNSYWRNFAAIISIKLLTTDPEQYKWRLWCANCLVGYSYMATKDVMEFAFDWRSQLGDDFTRLQQLAIEASGVRSTFMTTTSDNSIWMCRNVQFDINGRMKQLVETFCGCESSMAIPNLSKVADRSVEEINKMIVRDQQTQEPVKFHPEVQRRIDRLYGFEVEQLKAAFGWLERLEEVECQAEQAQVLELLENLLGGLLRPLGGIEDAIADGKNSGDSFYNHPREFGNWLFPILIKTILQVGPSNQSERLWKPILQMGLDRIHWVEAFVSSWFQHGLAGCNGQTCFRDQWIAMIDFAWDQENWFNTKVRHNEANESLFMALMGFTATRATAVPDEKYRPVVKSMESRYTKWADHFLPHPEVTRGYAVLLNGPAFSDLRFAGVKRLAAATPEFIYRHWREHNYLATALLNLLETHWRDSKGKIVSNPEHRSAFTTLLKAMTDRQIPRALELQDRFFKSPA